MKAGDSLLLALERSTASLMATDLRVLLPRFTMQNRTLPTTWTGLSPRWEHSLADTLDAEQETQPSCSWTPIPWKLWDNEFVVICSTEQKMNTEGREAAMWTAKGRTSWCRNRERLACSTNYQKAIVLRKSRFRERGSGWGSQIILSAPRRAN